MTGMLPHLSCTLSPAFVLRRSSMWGLLRSPQCHRNRCAVCLPASLLGCHSSICAQLSAPSACLGATTQQSTHLVLPVAVPPRCCMRKGVLRAARGANPPLPLRVQRGGRPHPPHQIHCVQQMLGLQHKSVIVSLMHPAHETAWHTPMQSPACAVHVAILQPAGGRNPSGWLFKGCLAVQPGGSV